MKLIQSKIESYKIRTRQNDRNFRYICEFNLPSFFAENVIENNYLLYLHCMALDKVDKFFHLGYGILDIYQSRYHLVFPK